MNELALKEKFGELVTQDDLEMFRKFDEIEKRVKAKKSELQESVMSFLKENDLTEGFEMDGVRFTYVKPSKRKIADIQKMKDEGVYELYTKESEVKESVRISIQYED